MKNLKTTAAWGETPWRRAEPAFGSPEARSLVNADAAEKQRAQG